MARLKTIEQQLEDAVGLIHSKNKNEILLRKELRKLKSDAEDMADVCKRIWEIKELEPAPPTWLLTQTNPKLPGVPMTMWSDWHYGEKVSRTQVNGANEFNIGIANTRIKRLVHTTLDLTLHHMVQPKYPGIVVNLAGDFTSGSIHQELSETNEVPLMVGLVKLQEQMIAALEAIADKFGAVFVPCVVGNHGRTTLKPRAKNRVFDSYEWHLYQALRAYFKKDTRLHFLIPDAADARYSVLGHNFLLTHGDALGVRGGDGIIGIIGPFARGITKIVRAEAAQGRRVDTVLCGHGHTRIPRGDAVPGMMNGCLCGVNEYSTLFLRAPAARPVQELWFMHEKHGFTASWPLYLDIKPSARTEDWVRWPGGQ